MKLLIHTSILFTLSFFTCGNKEHIVPVKKSDSEESLDPIWYKGNAEISTFDLKQNRYENIHPGEAVLVFVTEPFLTDKQVKNDSGHSNNSVSILKNNQIRRFTTGIYDYSIFTSVFTNAVNFTTYKVTNSSQDWCGQSFSQLNKIDNGYRFELRSYFEAEGDRKKNIRSAILEDELFNIIRIDESGLPLGEFEIIMANHVARLLHKPMDPIKATATLSDYENKDMEGEKLKSYRVSMPSISRELEIIYDSETSTNEIVGWKDSSPSVFDNKIRTTVAKRKSLLWKPYWNLNNTQDTIDRKKLLLYNY